MNSHQIILVKTSWAVIVPHSDAVGDLFYRHLFTIDPALRAMFPTDIRPQSRKLMAMLTLLVDQLEHTELVSRAIMGLAERHRQYGVQPGQYATVGQALLQTLNDGLGERWVPAVQDAWTTLYQTVAGAMTAPVETEKIC